MCMEIGHIEKIIAHVIPLPIPLLVYDQGFSQSNKRGGTLLLSGPAPLYFCPAPFIALPFLSVACFGLKIVFKRPWTLEKASISILHH